MWALYNQAKAWATRPSDLLAVGDRWLAFCLDNAVYTFGSALEMELKGTEGKNKKEIQNKQQRTLDKWLDMPLKFRSPGMVGPGDEEITVRGG